jgi:hypothetical protein
MRRIDTPSTGHEYRGLGGGRDCNREDSMTLKTLETRPHSLDFGELSRVTISRLFWINRREIASDKSTSDSIGSELFSHPC